MASYGANTQNSAAQAYATALGTGSLVIYAGTPPANAKAALGSNPVLATHNDWLLGNRWCINS